MKTERINKFPLVLGTVTLVVGVALRFASPTYPIFAQTLVGITLFVSTIGLTLKFFSS